MKKVYFLIVALIATSITFSQDSNDSLTFESYNLGSDEYYNGEDENGNIIIGDFTLENSYNPSWFVWEGFAISKVQDITTSGWANQYASYANGGADGSDQYGIYYGGTIEFNSPRVVKSLQVTNTTYAALSMKDGDQFAKKFGEPNDAEGNPDGTNGEDWFLLEIMPLDENDNLVGNIIEFYLADYRYADNDDDYIINTWETIVFPSSTVAKKITFRLTSSDNHPVNGMNTPGYFALDNLVASPTVGLNSVQSSLNAKIYPNPASGKLTVVTEENTEMELFNTFGQIVKTGVVNGLTNVNISDLPSGIYTIYLKSTHGSTVQKVVIQ